jgi:Na+/H+-translocating membrane pyrophosphatase
MAWYGMKKRKAELPMEVGLALGFTGGAIIGLVVSALAVNLFVIRRMNL